MSQKIHKFGSSELIRFIEIYRAHECLWDTEDSNYKNRDARNGALEAFARELSVEGFKPKEITNRIKNLRTQYHGEKKKVRDSMGTGSGAADVYKPKLFWYEVMDSFLTKTSEPRPTTSNLEENSENIHNILFEYTNENDETINTPMFQNFNPVISKSTKKRRSSKDYIDTALNKLENIKKRARTEDQLDTFGKYVACTLRSLNARNCIHAQDKINAILSKYRLKEIQEKESLHFSTPMPETHSPNSRQGENEEGWWNT